MTGSNGNGMSPTEKWYWALVASMIAVVLIHIFPYPLLAWSSTKYHCKDYLRTGERTPICVRVLRFFFLVVYPIPFFGLFAYGFPLMLLGDDQYCSGGRDERTNCKSAQDAGENPFVFVFLPTLFMWAFDTTAFYMLGLLKQRDPSGSNSSNNICGQIPRVMFPRFGLTLVYCGLICFAGSLRTRIELEQLVSSEDTDTDAKLSFVERQKTAGIVSFVLASVVWSIPIVIFSHRVYTQKRSRANAAENIQM